MHHATSSHSSLRRSAAVLFALPAVALLLTCFNARVRAEGGDHGGDDRPVVPAILEPPADQRVSEHGYAVGVQIYVVTQSPTDPSVYLWSFKAPEANLYDRKGKLFATHYVGPTWENKDHSKVVGTVLQKSPSPDPTAIPWLLLGAASHDGSGHFKDVNYIQRVNTAGGLAPTTGADAAHLGQEARVDYTAEYYFYKTDDDGDDDDDD